MGKRLNEQFAKEKIQKATWLSLVTKKIQIKITLRYHYIPTRMALLKKTGSSRSWQGWGETGILTHFWWECKTPKKTRQNKTNTTKQLQLNSFWMYKHGFIIEPCIYTPWRLCICHTKTRTQMFRAALLKHRKQSKCPASGELIKFDPYNTSQQ